MKNNFTWKFFYVWIVQFKGQFFQNNTVQKLFILKKNFQITYSENNILHEKKLIKTV